MCKSHSIRYICDHIFTFRISVCNGHFVSRPWSPSREPSVLCSSAPTLCVASRSDCGPCVRAKTEDPAKERIDELTLQACAEAEVATTESSFGLEGQADEHVDFARTELNAAVEDLGRLQYRLAKQYPSSQQFKQFRTPTPATWIVRPSKSSLRNHVSLEELQAFTDAEQRDEIDEDAAWAPWYEDWNCGWSESNFSWPAEDSNGEDCIPNDAVLPSYEASIGEPESRASTTSLLHEEVHPKELSDLKPSLRRASGSSEEGQQQRIDLCLLVNGLNVDTSNADNVGSLRSLEASTHNWQWRARRSLPPCHSTVTTWIEVRQLIRASRRRQK